MDAELKVKWIAALRSGDFKQAKGYLEYRGAFCCLGVLCMVQDRQPSKMFRPHEIGTSELPRELSGGLDDITCEALADMNDTGESFGQIADFIERTL